MNKHKAPIKHEMLKSIGIVGLFILGFGVLEAHHINNNGPLPSQNTGPDNAPNGGNGPANNNLGPNGNGVPQGPGAQNGPEQNQVNNNQSLGNNGQRPGANGPGQNQNIALTPGQNPNTQLATLGNLIFFDTTLSTPVGQSCASCHDASVAFSEANKDTPISEGAVAGRFGSRNTPTITYAATIPPFNFAVNNRRFRGGLFWDGRSDNLQMQALDPFFNPLEMNNENTIELADKILSSSYSNQFISIFGADALDDPDQLVAYVGQALAEFEQSEIFNPFNAKFDAVEQGAASFTQSEARGRRLFFGRARCGNCHSSRRGGNDGIQVFSDFSYVNTGVPANNSNPFYNQSSEFNPEGVNFIDHGLGNTTGLASQNGKFRVPNLRNIGLTSPYMHNGVFNTLEEVLEFYNSRNISDAEVTDNITNRGGIGNLNLSNQDMSDLIAFLNTLTDGEF